MADVEQKPSGYRALGYTCWTMAGLVLLDWTLVGAFSRDHLPILPLWGGLLLIPFAFFGGLFCKLGKEAESKHLPPQAPVDAEGGGKRV
jgi:hypothetical protein